MKLFYWSITFLLLALNGFSQSTYDELRYRHAIFSQVDTTFDVEYGSAPQWVWPYWNEDLILDVFQPNGDVVTNRPLIIFAHAGGFLNGSRDVDDMVALCDSFARKGYVTATIDYRKGFNPLDAESAERAVYRGVQDGKAAVRFFKENASTFGIDTNFIYFGGMSAGGFMSLHVAYMDEESERPASTYGGGTVNDLGCLDCSGNSYSHTSKVRAILDYWGAIQDTIDIVAGNTPLMIMHGTDDPTVPFIYGQPFGLATLPYVYGGSPVHERVNNLGIYNEFYTSNAPGAHMLDGSDNGTFTSGANDFWYDTLLPRTTDFLVRMTKPNPLKVSPDTISVCMGEAVSLEVDGDVDSYYRWGYDATNLTASTNTNSEILQLEYGVAGTYSISVVEFNEVYCSSDTLWFVIQQQAQPVPDYNYSITGTGVSFTNTIPNQVIYHWDFGDGSTSTEENPNHTYANYGTYNVTLTVTNEYGCSEEITKTVEVQNLSVENILITSVSIYPNPFKDEISIENLTSESIDFEIIDINGKLIEHEQRINGSSTAHVNTSNWSRGVYFIQTMDTSGKVSMNKIVK